MSSEKWKKFHAAQSPVHAGNIFKSDLTNPKLDLVRVCTGCSMDGQPLLELAANWIHEKVDQYGTKTYHLKLDENGNDTEAYNNILAMFF